MTLTTATKIATAFDTYAALLTACQGGYVPTLRAGESDELPLRRAKTVLQSALEAAGCKVYG